MTFRYPVAEAGFSGAVLTASEQNEKVLLADRRKLIGGTGRNVSSIVNCLKKQIAFRSAVWVHTNIGIWIKLFRILSGFLNNSRKGN